MKTLTRIIFLLTLLVAVSAVAMSNQAELPYTLKAVFTPYEEPLSGYPSAIVEAPILALEPGESNKFSKPISWYENKANWRLRRVNGEGKVTDAQISIKKVVMKVPGRFESLSIYIDPADLRKGDKLNVAVITATKENQAAPEVEVLVVDSDEENKLSVITIPEDIALQDLNFDPSLVEKQKMLDDSEQTVGHLDVKGKFWLGSNPLPVYVTTKSTISSSNDDISSKLDLRLGAKKFLGTAYLPVVFEAGVVSNQRFSNASLVGFVGIDNYIIPTGLIYGVGYYKVGDGDEAKIKKKISYAPRLRLGVQYAHQLRTDDRLKTGHDLQNTLRLTGTVELLRTYLGRLSRNPNSNVIFTANATGWYFPSEKATSGFKVRRFEGLLDAGLTFELRKDLAFKLTWTTGAQESNNFARCSTFGIAFIKSN